MLIFSDISSLKIHLSKLKKEGNTILFSTEKEQPFKKNIEKLMRDRKHLEDVLKKGKQKANIIAEENLKNIREKVGLI